MNKVKIYILFICLVFSGYAWVTWNIIDESNNHGLFTPCLFKQITHIPCPSCGATRSLACLLHGNVAQAMLINPFGLLLAIAMLIIPIWILIDVLRRSDSFYRAYLYLESVLKQKTWISIPLITIVIVNWVWNILKGL